MVVVDTSALIALLLQEPRWADVEHTLRREPCIVPAPVLLEFGTVAAGRYRRSERSVATFLDAITVAPNLAVADFGADDARLARLANQKYGKGRGNRAQLNVFDLMVYGIASRLKAPILCTGRDFAETDALIHPASRLT